MSCIHDTCGFIDKAKDGTQRCLFSKNILTDKIVNLISYGSCLTSHRQQISNIKMGSK